MMIVEYLYVKMWTFFSKPVRICALGSLFSYVYRFVSKIVEIKQLKLNLFCM